MHNPKIIKRALINRINHVLCNDNLIKLVSSFDFKKRSKSHSEECICYKEKKPCHDIPDLNCFLCYCPEYKYDAIHGGCKVNSKHGKWYSSSKFHQKIWDCSDCTYPHTKETALKYLKNAIGDMYHLK